MTQKLTAFLKFSTFKDFSKHSIIIYLSIRLKQTSSHEWCCEKSIIKKHKVDKTPPVHHGSRTKRVLKPFHLFQIGSKPILLVKYASRSIEGWNDATARSSRMRMLELSVSIWGIGQMKPTRPSQACPSAP